MKIAMALVLFAGVAAGQCREALNSPEFDIAVAELHGKIADYNGMDWAFSAVSASELTREQDQINHYQRWAMRLAPSCMRKAYLDVLSVYQRNLDAAIAELRTHAQQKSFDQYLRRREAENKAKAKYRATHKVPHPE